MTDVRSDEFAEPCHAKVNLVLEVRGKRADGYHELWTIFDELELHDELLWIPTAKGPANPASVSLVVRGGDTDARSVPADASNLVCRAAAAFAAAYGKSVAGTFILTKNIPAGGGLGGGSSDAAAALRILARQFGVPVNDSSLLTIACGVGADVPFFLHGRRAWASGRGDEIHPIAAGPALSYMLLFPGYACSTANVFSRWHRELTHNKRELDSSGLAARPRVENPTELLDHVLPTAVPEAPARGLYNDLALPAMEACPALGVLCARLREVGFVLHLSGSGSTLFLAGTPGWIEEQGPVLEEVFTRLRSESFPGLGVGARLVRTRSRCGAPQAESVRDRGEEALGADQRDPSQAGGDV